MFKYLWIIVIIGLYIFWTVKAWKELFDEIKEYGKNCTIQEILCDCEILQIWILIHLCAIFILSLFIFIKNPPPFIAGDPIIK